MVEQAIQYQLQGKLYAALAAYRVHLDAFPDDPVAWNGLGATLLSTSDNAGALEAFKNACRLEPQTVWFKVNLGSAYLAQERISDALACYESVLESDPLCTAAYAGLINVAQQTGDLESASRLHEKKHQIESDIGQSKFEEGLEFLQSGQLDDAISTFAEGTRICSWSAPLYWHLSRALMYSNRFDEALNCGVAAINLWPSNPWVYLNYAEVLARYRQPKVALRVLDSAAQSANRDETFALHAQFLRSHLLLMLGNYHEGWRDFESRYAVDERVRQREAELPSPVWHGHECLKNKRLLIYSEQGYGDFIQFLRFARLVKALKAHVIVTCLPVMLRLVQNVEGIDEVTTYNDPMPAHDFHCSDMTLASRFVEHIVFPAPTSITLPKTWVTKRRHLLRQLAGADNKLKVGVAWAGRGTTDMGIWHRYHDQNRSVPLPLLDRLLNHPRVSAFSLLKEDGDPVKRQIPDGLAILDLQEHITDFADTAVTIQCLDIVVSVDTSVAHLAASLGKPTYLLLNYSGEWRWGADGETTPWYPSMKILRQSTPGYWEDVVERLVEHVGGISSALT